MFALQNKGLEDRKLKWPSVCRKRILWIKISMAIFPNLLDFIWYLLSELMSLCPKQYHSSLTTRGRFLLLASFYKELQGICRKHLLISCSWSFPLFAALYSLSASSTFCLQRLTAVSVHLGFVLLLHLVLKCNCLWGGMTHAVEPYHRTIV